MPCGIQTFSETDVPASILEKPKIQFLQTCLSVRVSVEKQTDPTRIFKELVRNLIVFKSIPKDLVRNPNDSQLMSKGFGKVLIDFLMIWQGFDYFFQGLLGILFDFQ